MVKTVTIRQPVVVRGSARSLQIKLKGQVVKRVARRGKLLLIDLQSDLTLILHLKMTGQLFFYDQMPLTAGGHGQDLPVAMAQGKPGKHTHVSFAFTDGSVLHFTDQRRFGYVSLIDAVGRKAAIARYGPEPSDPAFTVDYLANILSHRKAVIKNVLLNQALLSGLGNIYADEVAHRAKVRPMRRANKISQAEVIRLYRAIKKVLADAIKLRGTSFSDYRDARGNRGGYLPMLKVYGHAGEQCKTCRVAAIKKTKVNGRGTHYCPKCQK
jgi:formamidopyrimidine-DNA glycosylase